MSEIEKLYENAGVKKKYDCSDCEYLSGYICPKCSDKQLKYPEFTAEKQLELIKWLSITKAVLIKQNRIFIGFETGNPKDLKCAEDLDLNFEETLAGLINNIWKDLTDTEKVEIKRILE